MNSSRNLRPIQDQRLRVEFIHQTMGIFSDEKPYTAVTNWVEQLCSEQYDEDDYTGVPDLCDVARLQSTG
jgi:hypothetical protein